MNKVSTEINGFKYILNADKTISIYLSLSLVHLNNRIIRSIVFRDWNLLSESRLGIGSVLSIRSSYNGSMVVDSYNNNTRDSLILRPEYCPICNSRLNNKGNTISCHNSECGHYDILFIWKYLKYCLFIRNIEYWHVSILYTKHKIKSLVDLYEKDISDITLSGVNMVELQRKLESKIVNIRLSNLMFSMLHNVRLNVCRRLSLTKINKWYNGVDDIHWIDGVRYRDSVLTAMRLANSYYIQWLAKYKTTVMLLKEKANIVLESDLKENDKHNLKDKVVMVYSSNIYSKSDLVDFIKLAGGWADKNIERYEGKVIDIAVADSKDYYQVLDKYKCDIITDEELLTKLDLNKQ